MFFQSCLKLKQLEERLQCVETFAKPKLLLEQYETPWHLSSQILYAIQTQYGDIENKIVADLGCGCGALSIGAAALNANYVIGLDIDQDALDIFTTNIREHNFTDTIDCIQCDILNLPNKLEKKFDTVIMNPPFGTKKNPGIDIKFLEAALKVSSHAVYSLHKTSTRNHILKTGKAFGTTVNVVAELQYDLSATYKFHKKKSVDIYVDLVRFTH